MQSCISKYCFDFIGQIKRTATREQLAAILYKREMKETVRKKRKNGKTRNAHRRLIDVSRWHSTNWTRFRARIIVRFYKKMDISVLCRAFRLTTRNKLIKDCCQREISGRGGCLLQMKSIYRRYLSKKWERWWWITHAQIETGSKKLIMDCGFENIVKKHLELFRKVKNVVTLLPYVIAQRPLW